MYAWFRKLKAGLVKSDINDYIGTKGEMFFNTVTGEFRISDGVTRGGQPIPAASMLVSLKGVKDINFDQIQNNSVLTYNHLDDQFIWTQKTQKFTKYMEGFEYTVSVAEHGIPVPSSIAVYDPTGTEVSVEVLLEHGNVTVKSNVLLDGHTVCIV